MDWQLVVIEESHRDDSPRGLPVSYIKLIQALER